MDASTARSAPLLTATAARRLFLAAQGLLADPARRAGPAATARLVEQLGFVQIDSIRVVERAHHLILAARLDGYRPVHLRRLLESERRLFEHWTHDAAAIPSAWFPHWWHRFERHRRRIERTPWWRERLGPDSELVLTQVRQRLRQEGPLQSKDFAPEHRGEPGGWWSWKPPKAALEYLWHTGELAIARRVHFQKVYDLTERVLPQVAHLPPSAPEAHTDWACRTALERLGTATASEIAAFWRAIDLAAVRDWCHAAEGRGEILAVRVESAAGGPPRCGWAPHDWERRLRDAPEPPARIRVLAPFDPILRDRRRTRDLFGFDYRFEAFVRAAQRRHGYYVLPILDGDRLVGRLDPEPRRDRGPVRARHVWWEPGVRPTRARQRSLAAALERLSECIDPEG